MSSDCLVLKLEEIDTISELIDTSIYVLYDTSIRKYLILGSRLNESGEDPFEEYAFRCASRTHVELFLKTCVCKKNRVNITLFNYSKLPSTAEEITYSELKDMEYSSNEIVAYDNRKLRKFNIKEWLNVLKYIYNIIG